jgi:eukaryotic-like serine/threonine-protein kinase
MLGGRYRIVGWLGAGGMSEVWRGHDEVLDRPVAIKMLAGRQATDDALRGRIRLEAKAAARLSHPHITNVYDYGEAPGPAGEPVPFVVMELVNGVPMAADLADDRALPWPVAVRACAQVAAALAAAHAQGIVHRDVKPGNVMLTTAGAKVLDFGISASIGEPDVDEDGRLLGTPAYLAPERVDGTAVTPACDVYALGLLLRRSLTGSLPWAAQTLTQMLNAHRHVEPDPMPPVDGLPPEVAALCERCLAKDPADRPTSEQAARELMEILGGAPEDVASPVDIRPASRPTTMDTVVASPRHWRARLSKERLWRARRSRVGALVAAGLLGVAAAVGGLAWPTGTHRAHDTPAEAAEAGDASAPGSCAVELRVSRDTGSAMTANLTIKNTGSQPLPNWQLSFDLPGDQRLRQGTNATWRQEDRTVTARSGGADLPPVATARLGFTAGYHAGNPLPVTYRVNSITCTAVVLGPSGSANPTPATTPGPGKDAPDKSGDDKSGDDKKKHGKGKGHGKD